MRIYSPELESITTGTPDPTNPILMLDATGNVIRGEAGGGTTINTTDTFLPVRTDATTFGDSYISQPVSGEGGSTLLISVDQPFVSAIRLEATDTFSGIEIVAQGIDSGFGVGGINIESQDGNVNLRAGNAGFGTATNGNVTITAAGATSEIQFFSPDITAPSTGTTGLAIDSTGKVVTSAGGGTNPTSTFLPINVDGVFVDSAVSQPGPGCNGGTDVLDQSQRSSTGSGGYAFRNSIGGELSDETTLSTAAFDNIELNAGAENPNNTFPIPQTPSDAPFTDLEIAVLEAAGFVITDVQALASSVSQTRNAPADFDSFTTTWTQAGTTASFLLNVSSVKVVRSNGKVYIGGTGAAATAGPASIAPALNAIQASDYVTEPSGSYRRSVESNVDPFNLTTRQSGDWNVGCVFGSAVTVTTNLDVAGTSTTTPGSTNTFSMDFGATGLATALQTTVGFRLTGFGTDGSAAGGLAQFLNDNNIQSGDDIFITGTGNSGGTGTFRFLEFPFAPGNLNSVVFDGYAADGLPTEASDTVAGGLNPSVGVTAFQDEISNSTTQTVTYTSAASTTTVGGDLTVASGVFLNNLPTADPGVTGQVWNNAGVLNISL